MLDTSDNKKQGSPHKTAQKNLKKNRNCSLLTNVDLRSDLLLVSNSLVIIVDDFAIHTGLRLQPDTLTLRG